MADANDVSPSGSMAVPAAQNTQDIEVLGSVLNETVSLSRLDWHPHYRYWLTDDMGHSFPVWPDEVPEYMTLLGLLTSHDELCGDGPGRGHDCRAEAEPVECTDAVDVQESTIPNSVSLLHQCQECDRILERVYRADGWKCGAETEYGEH